MKRSTFKGYVVGLVVGIGLMSVGNAFANDAPANPARHDAVVICAHLAEDSAAHVRLVNYGPDGSPLVYRCERTGY